MRFTREQYDQAIELLQLGKEQLEPDGRYCSICTDSDHMAFECGFNPLVAMKMCEAIGKVGDEFHEVLHWFAGYDFNFMVQQGPKRIRLPADDSQK